MTRRRAVTLTLAICAVFWLAAYAIAGWRGVAAMAAGAFFVEVLFFALVTRVRTYRAGVGLPSGHCTRCGCYVRRDRGTLTLSWGRLCPYCWFAATGNDPASYLDEIVA